MAPSLARLDGTADCATLCEVLSRDGAVVVEDALTPTQLKGLNGDLDRIIAVTPPGVAHPTEDDMVAFFGQSTIRIDGLPAKSETFTEVMLSPLLCGVADHFLLPHCHDYLFNTGQLIEIGPGETAQRLHRDEDVWRHLPAPKPHVEIEAMFALSDFTAANGATQVAPGSHLWPSDREAEPAEIVQAEMKAGSALFYLGSVLHGGGANRTDNERRRGMFLGYVLGWLRTEENSFLSVPLEAVRSMPVRVQELLGYKAHRAMGVVDVGSPMKLLG
ncbi:MAG: mitomycin antibiotic biosynthesis protein [Alphaproteobacteria bacterium]|nr:mitomycin antibiotic biosynthesis protein [Alphaproteobacteria bacterium]